MPEPILVHLPPAATPPQRLVLMFHGVGADAPGLVPLGRRLAAAFPQDAILSVPAPFASDLGAGRQWFSVRGVTEENRPGRVAQVLPRFAETVHALQAAYDVAPSRTVLVGFSQGAIMALEAARAGLRLAGCVVSLSGRFALLPQDALAGTVVHLIHGDSDTVIGVEHATAAAARLAQLGTPANLDVLPETGHEITPATAQRLVERLNERSGG